MLLNLHVKNLAIIDEIEVDFTEHLNILTGETGAGKSIIIGSINMALGGKVMPDFIRKGAEFGFVELVFQMEDVEFWKKIQELDLDISSEEQMIIVSRKITKNRSICKINGVSVTAATVRAIAGYLIDIHGQHEHQSLLYKKKHLDIVDRFSKEHYGSLQEDLSSAYLKYQALEKKIAQVAVSEEERLREQSFLEYEVNEIASAKLLKDEDIELEIMFKKLSNAEEIAQGIGMVHQITGSGTEAVSDAVSRASRILSKLEEYDEPIKNFSIQIADIDNLINDFNRELSDYLESLEYDSAELNQIEQRLNLIHTLKAKYGNTIEEIQMYYENACEKLKKYEDYDQYMNSLYEEMKQIESTLLNYCTRISEIRKECAKKLANKIKIALVDLNFLDIQFDISFKRLQNYTENGFDEVEFLISTNPGEDLKPLGRVASGGELSRIMLAIKSVLAQQDAIDSLIFDEIDVGISGRTAQKVSEKLAMLAKNHQIICITHLPQIASMCDQHFIIEKSTDGQETRTNIYTLTYEQSVKELARMLSGAKMTEAVIENAKEMKELAANTKKY